MRSASETLHDQCDAYRCKQDSEEKYAKVVGKLDPNRHKADGEAGHDEDDAHYYGIDPDKTLAQRPRIVR